MEAVVEDARLAAASCELFYTLQVATPVAQRHAEEGIWRQFGGGLQAATRQGRGH